jgi:hypothetical protein
LTLRQTIALYVPKQWLPEVLLAAARRHLVAASADLRAAAAAAVRNAVEVAPDGTATGVLRMACVCMGS